MTKDKQENKQQEVCKNNHKGKCIVDNTDCRNCHGTGKQPKVDSDELEKILDTFKHLIHISECRFHAKVDTIKEHHDYIDAMRDEAEKQIKAWRDKTALQKALECSPADDNEANKKWNSNLDREFCKGLNHGVKLYKKRLKKQFKEE